MKIQACLAGFLCLISILMHGAAEPQIPALNELPDPALEIIGSNLYYRDLSHLCRAAKHFSQFKVYKDSLAASKKATELVGAWKKGFTKVKVQQTTQNRAFAKAIDISPDGKLIACAAEHGFYLRDAVTGETVSGVFERGETCDSLAFFKPDPSTLRLAEISQDHIRTWNILKMEPGNDYFATIQKELANPHLGYSIAAAYSTNSTIASGLRNGIVHIWTKDNQHKQFVDVRAITSLAFSPDEKFLAIGTAGGSVSIGNLETSEIIKLPFESNEFETSRVSCVIFSPDQKYVAASFYRTEHGQGGYVVWDLSTHKEVIKHAKVNESFISVSFSPDSKIIASSTQNGVMTLTCIESANYINTLMRPDYTGGKYPVFSPDGKSIAAVTSNGYFVLWRAGVEPKERDEH